MKQLFLGIAGILLVSVCFGIGIYRPPHHEIRIDGIAQGTNFSVIATLPVWQTKKKVTQTVLNTFDTIDRQVSRYQDSSEISRLNAASANTRIPISGDFQALLRLATRLYELSDGAWDGTVVGQGPVGFWMIEFGPGYVTKKQNNITLSLDSIAQGYTVDLVVSELVRLGATSAVAELGGEVRVFSSDQRPFRINVALPDTDYQQFSGQITLTNAAAATTGIEKGVIKVLDPQNRRPKPTNFQSIIVVAPTGAIADGLSTTLWALHPGKWTGVLTEFENVSVYVIQNDGQLKKW